MASDQNQPKHDKIDSILGAVLTGGQSRRMGRDKATIVVGDRPLAERAIGVLAEVFSKVVVVSNGNPAHLKFDVPVVEDQFKECGPLGGLHAALQAAVAAKSICAVFLLACDMPFISTDLIRYLATPVETSRSVGAWARIPSTNDRIEPLCGVYSAGCLAAATEALEAGKLRMNNFLGAVNTEFVEITRDLPCFDWNIFSNANRPGDLFELYEEKSRFDSLGSQDLPVVKA